MGPLTPELELVALRPVPYATRCSLVSWALGFRRYVATTKTHYAIEYDNTRQQDYLLTQITQ